jgi:hypothetical protein
MEMTPRLAEQIEETHDAVNELMVLLKGVNGTPGLCRQVEAHAKRIRMIELMLAFAAGGGGIAFGAVKILGL